MEDETAKRQRIDELRRKRQSEKQRRIQREMEHLKFTADMERVKHFDRCRLLKWAFHKFRNLLRWRKLNEQLAVAFWRKTMQGKHLVKWRERVSYVWSERKKRAELFYDRQCVRMAFQVWHRYYLAEHGKWLVAVDWYDMRISERYFRVWKWMTTSHRLMYEMKEKQAEAHYEW